MVEQIEVVQGRDENWVRFRDMLECKIPLTGNVYHNPTLSSWRRLLRLLSDDKQIKVEFIPDDYGMIIRGWKR